MNVNMRRQNIMLPLPKKFSLVAGKGEGKHKLTAFDKALIDSGIGNMNLLRVSSVLPPECKFIPVFSMPLGSLLPVAYGSITSDVPGETIAAAIGVGIPENPMDNGMIMEYSGFVNSREAAIAVEEMVKESFELRDLVLKDVMVKSVEHTVVRNGSVIAACPLFY